MRSSPVPAGLDAIATRLNESGIAFHRAVDEGGLLLLDAHDVLAGISVDGVASVEGFRAALSRFVEPSRTQRIYGEVVSLLARRGDFKTALGIEAFGHHFYKDVGQHDIQRQHTHVESDSGEPITLH